MTTGETPLLSLMTRFNRRMSIAFLMLYALCAAALVLISEHGFWLRLMPGIFGCIGAIVFFVSRWSDIDFRQKHARLSDSDARVRVSIAAVISIALLVAVMYLLVG